MPLGNKTVTESNELLAHMAREGAKLPGSCGRMCGDCAFAVGTAANADKSSVEDALQVLSWEGEFWCHNTDFTCTETLCVGFQYARKYLLSPEFFKNIKFRKHEES